MQVIQTARPPVLAAALPHSSVVVQSTAFKSFRAASGNLWRGVQSVILGAGPAHALHFATYEAAKESFGANRPGQHILATAAAGACATLAHDTLMNPFDGMYSEGRKKRAFF